MENKKKCETKFFSKRFSNIKLKKKEKREKKRRKKKGIKRKEPNMLLIIAFLLLMSPTNQPTFYPYS